MKKYSILFSALILFIFVPKASAQFEFGLAAGTEYGFGLLARVGTPTVMLELGGGLAPQFVFWTVYGGSNSYLKFYLPATVGAKLSFSSSKSSKESRIGFKFGVSYNTILKTGFGGGVDYTWGEKTRFVISGGAMYYPQAYDELLERLNDAEGTSYGKEDTSSVLMNFQPFVSFGIIF